jgi:hypothetical protein
VLCGVTLYYISCHVMLCVTLCRVYIVPFGIMFFLSKKHVDNNVEDEFM